MIHPAGGRRIDRQSGRPPAGSPGRPRCGGASAAAPCWAARALTRRDEIDERKNSAKAYDNCEDPICNEARRPVEGNVNGLAPLGATKEFVRELDEAELDDGCN